MMMEWDTGACLALIDEYERYPELWSPKHGLYYNRRRKVEVWALIAKALDCTADEVRKKMDSILASFRREKGKGTKIAGTGEDAHEVYVSKWFAFERMAFLMDRETPRALYMSAMMAADDENVSIVEAEEVEDFKFNPTTQQRTAPAAADEDSDLSNSNPVSVSVPLSASQTHSRSQQSQSRARTTTVSPSYNPSSRPSYPTATTFRMRRRRKRPRLEQQEVEEAEVELGEDDDEEFGGTLRRGDPVHHYNNNKPTNLKTTTTNLPFQLQDECGVFGLHIANKLRAYDPVTRAIVEHEINNCIFKADMRFHQPSISMQVIPDRSNPTSSPSPERNTTNNTNTTSASNSNHHHL